MVEEGDWKLEEKQGLQQKSDRFGSVGTERLVEAAEGNAAEEEEEPAADARQELARVVAAGCGFVHRVFLVVLVHHVLGSLLRAAVAVAGTGGPDRFLAERR